MTVNETSALSDKIDALTRSMDARLNTIEGRLENIESIMAGFDKTLRGSGSPGDLGLVANFELLRREVSPEERPHDGDLEKKNWLLENYNTIFIAAVIWLITKLIPDLLQLYGQWSISK